MVEAMTGAGASAPHALTSLTQLRSAHFQLMGDIRRLRYGSDQAGSAAWSVREAVQDFLAKARAAGAFVAADEDRRRAQDIIDYWTAELISEGAEPAEVKLDPIDPGRIAEPARADADAEIEECLEKSYSEIRLAAAARLWRDSAHGAEPERARGYLLTGKALTDADAIETADPDIRAFIRASIDAEKVTVGRRSRIWGAVSGVLGALILVAVLTSMKFIEVRGLNTKEARDSAGISDEKSKAEQLAAERQKTIVKLESELDAANRRLDAMYDTFRYASETGGDVTYDDLPSDIRAAINASASLTPNNVLEKLINDNKAAGYDRRFPGLELSLPSAAEGAPPLKILDYVNYSIGFDQSRGMAAFSASNLDRERRLFPPRASAFAPDPRIPPPQQPTPAWFVDERIDKGHLTPRQEIAWGPVFEVDEKLAAARLAAATDAMTNLAPQWADFNRGVWNELEDWILTQHNPAASRIAIYTGPVFAADDPPIDGSDATMPRRFWKIAASVGADGTLVVDAFMIAQSAANGTELPTTTFNPTASRTSVRRIEEMTGLVFAGALHAADLSEAVLLGGEMARDVRLLGAVDEAVRVGAGARIRSFLASAETPDDERRKVAAALTGMAAADYHSSLSPDGQFNLILVLSGIPKQTWEQTAWSDVRAEMRRAIDEIEAREIPIGPKTGPYWEKLKENVEPDLKDVQVKIEFAEITRGRALDIGAGLHQLGWTTSDTPLRTSKTSGANQVRYGAEADRGAAELLASDLHSLGVKGVEVTRSNLPDNTLQLAIGQGWSTLSQGWSIDLFYCQDSGAGARDQAERAADVLRGGGAAKNIRVRPLSASKRLEPGYATITGFQVRPNRGEQEIAAEFKNIIEPALDLQFDQVISISPTPFYLSAFFCPQSRGR